MAVARETSARFEEFLASVENVQRRMGCSLRSAWFRGHEQPEWRLLPSLLRVPRQSKPGELLTLADQTIFVEWRRKLHETRDRLKSRRASLKGRIDIHTNEIEGLLREEAAVKEAEEALREQRRNFTTPLTRGDTREMEIAAFNEFAFKSGDAYESSWTTLAAMQHHRVLTRLLDWTESLHIALFFALKDFRAALANCYRSRRFDLAGATIIGAPKPTSEPSFDACVRHCKATLPKAKQTPAIWVLNPYAAAKEAWKDASGTRLAHDPESIVNVSFLKGHDYFDDFLIGKGWPTTKAVPIYSPWRSQRIAAQQGLFTFHPDAREANETPTPLEESLARSKSVAKRELDTDVAVFACFHLKEVCNLDEFTLRRDLDSLGDRINSHYYQGRENPWTA